MIDLREIDPERFPNVFATLERAGLDPRPEPVPVSPAAHYLMGGIVTDLDGRSTLAGLYAVGECACTGVHGANRLASNSLTECFVFGERAARARAGEAMPAERAGPGRVAVRAADRRDQSGRLEPGGPDRATRSASRGSADDPYPLASLIARAALARRESRGSHRRTDFPLPAPGLDGIHLVGQGDDEPTSRVLGVDEAVLSCDRRRRDSTDRLTQA